MKDFWSQEKGFQVYLQGSRGQPRNFVCPGNLLSLAVLVRLRLVHGVWEAIVLNFLTWNLEKCISVKMADGTCDDECNTLACNWDGDDCDGISPSKGGTDQRPSFYQSIDFVDVLFSRNIGIG